MVRVRVGVTFEPVLECNGDGNLRESYFSSPVSSVVSFRQCRA